MIQGLRKLLGLDPKKQQRDKGESRAIAERRLMESAYGYMNHRERRAAERIALKWWLKDYLAAVSMVRTGDKARVLKGKQWLAKLLLMCPKEGPGSLTRAKSGTLYLVQRNGLRMLPEV